MSVTDSDRVLRSEDLADLVSVARALYPHPGLGDGPYERAVAVLAGRAEHEPAVLHTLTDGLADLRREVGEVSGTTPNELEPVLAQRQSTDFFSLTRSVIAWELYDDHEVWEHVGYPGASFDRGGYLSRGFDDLDWLPEPRIEESPLPMTEIGPLPTTPFPRTTSFPTEERA